MTEDFWRKNLIQTPAKGCCGDPGDCAGCVVTDPEIEQLAAEQAATVYFDGEGNSASLDEVLS